MPFTSQGQCLDNIFITEAEIIDRYVGNQLWTWGRNARGQLGNNAATNQSSPVQTVSAGTNWKQVSLGAEHSSAIKTDGTLWLWGCGLSGQLGNNSTSDRSSPVQIISGGTNWKQVSAGRYHSAAVKTDGSLWLWGAGCTGRLGTNSLTNQSSPVQTVSAGTNWKQVSSASDNTGAIKTDGSLWLWGCGLYGIIGNNSSANQSSPVQTVSAGTNWKQISIGDINSVAVKTDGSLWVWGFGGDGNLGNNSLTTRSSPVQTISGGTNWKQAVAGATSLAAIKTDGTLWTWGRGSLGKLGNNSITNQSSPVQTVSGGTNWKQVSLAIHAMAIKTDGSLWLWGPGTLGKLGNNASIDQSSPVQTVSGGTNWKDVNAGTISLIGGHSSAAITFTEL